jgi:2-phosphosulfolactate phosphatase
MRLNVVLTPKDVEPYSLTNRAVAVFDVLRATTTIIAALAAGVSEIRIFDSIEAATLAAKGYQSAPILCGERNCLPPAGFDLGNSPGGFDAKLHTGRTVFMCTTNGTRAIIAARSAKFIFAAALVNASAVAKRLVATGLDVTLLCAGTNGEPAPEDQLGAGAVVDAISKLTNFDAENAVTTESLDLFRASKGHLISALANTTGGQNVLAVGLKNDIDFAAQIDSIAVVGLVLDDPLRIVTA